MANSNRHNMKTKLRGILTLLLALVVQISFAQEKQISGTVKDANGMALPGVNISVVGTDSGTQTDFNGHYSLTVEPGATLKFSFVGFADKTVKVGMQTTINVVLEQGETLETVMISTGYETQTKAKSTKSVTTITAEDIENQPSASLIDALQGKVPGLNIGSNSGRPGSGSTVILRGVGSINGKITPLYIIDGVPANQRSFNMLGPNEVESVNVLKGPNAIAVYGNRGANGVIVVTTKGGQYNKNLSFSFHSQYGFSTLMPLNLEMMNSKEKLHFLIDNELGVPDLPGLHKNMTDAEIANYAKHINTDWADVYFNPARTSRQDITISAGSENMATSTTLSYLNQDGVFGPSGLQRFGFRNKLHGKSSNDKFTYSTTLNTNFTKSDFNPNFSQYYTYFDPFMNALTGSPLVNPYDPDGSITQDGGLEPGDASAITPINSPIVLLNSGAMNTQHYERFNIIGNFRADWNFAKNLTAGVSIGANLMETRYTGITHPLSLLGPFQVDIRANYGGIQSESYQRDFRFVTRSNLNYNNSWNKHTLNVNLFTEYNRSYLNGLGYNTRGLDPKLIGTDAAFQLQVFESLGSGDPQMIYAQRTNLNLTNISIGMFSYFATADYDFDGRFGFSGSIRRDASVRFVDENKWGTFWSVSGRWNIDEESFMDGSAINMLKLRAGYGTTGNQTITGSYYGGLDLFRNLYTSNDGYFNSSGYVPANIANPTLRWETIKSMDIGLDFGIWKDKLHGKIDYYTRKTVDLYQSKPISAVNATTAINANIGSLINRGVEVFVKYNLLSTADWRISLYANSAYNKSELLELAGTDENGLVFNGGLTALKEGESLGEYYTVRYAGVNPSNGHPLFYDKNGNLTENIDNADRVFEDKFIYPTFKGGFGAVVSYKGFALSQDWVYKADVWRFSNDLSLLEDPSSYINNNSPTSLLNAWNQVGQITSVPRLNGQYDISDYGKTDRYIFDASYLRLRSVSLSYTFDRDQLKRLPFTSVQLYIQGQNLITFTSYPGYDPESGYTGIEISRYPSVKTYTLGLDLKF